MSASNQASKQTVKPMLTVIQTNSEHDVPATYPDLVEVLTKGGVTIDQDLETTIRRVVEVGATANIDKVSIEITSDTVVFKMPVTEAEVKGVLEILHDEITSEIKELMLSLSADKVHDLNWAVTLPKGRAKNSGAPEISINVENPIGEDPSLPSISKPKRKASVYETAALTGLVGIAAIGIGAWAVYQAFTKEA